MPITRKRYTPMDVRKIRTLYKRGKSFEEIGKAVDRTAQAIQVFISRLGWVNGSLKKKKRPYTEQEDNFIWKWRDDGHTNEVIAFGLGRTHSAIRQRVSLVGV